MIENLIQDLIQNGYCVQSGFLSADEVALVNQEMDSLQKNQTFREAGVGPHQRVASIRGDWTHWWELESLTPIQEAIFAKLENLKCELNRSLFLGLWDFEGHYAIYPPGAFYQKHLDRFQNDDRRKISIVLFFNQNWDVRNDGGALEIETILGHTIQVAPEAGTLVCFFSDQIPHQVLKTERERKSFAGWFRTRGRSGFTE